MSQHTPGPWRWELNLKSKCVQLCGGRPMFDLTVMDFVRWGMGSARPRFRKDHGGGLELMENAETFATVHPDREHHKHWFQLLRQADADLIAAAPDLLAACKEALGAFEQNHAIDWNVLSCAIAKAEGRA